MRLLLLLAFLLSACVAPVEPSGGAPIGCLDDRCDDGAPDPCDEQRAALERGELPYEGVTRVLDRWCDGNRAVSCVFTYSLDDLGRRIEDIVLTNVFECGAYGCGGGLCGLELSPEHLCASELDQASFTPRCDAGVHFTGCGLDRPYGEVVPYTTDCWAEGLECDPFDIAEVGSLEIECQ